MTNAFPLQPLVHLAKQKNEAATKKLGLLNRNQLSAQNKLEMLEQYRRDYQDKLQDAQRAGMELTDLRNFQDFLYRLDDAIAQQTAVVAQTRISVQQGRNELMEAQRRMKSFDTLESRHTETVKKQEAKIEQKIQDEHSGRRSAYKNAELNDEN